MTYRLLPLMIVLGCLVSTGCKHHRRPPAPPACPPIRGSTIPPVGIPEGPPPVAPVPRGVAPDNGSELILPQNPPPGTARSEYPRVVPSHPGGAVLGQPDYAQRPRVVEADPAPADEKPSAVSEAPVGISDFAQVKDGVGTGRRPTIDGLDWLKARGYKTVVYLRSVTDDDTTDRRQVERRDMKFLSVLLTPDTLTQQWVDDFNETVGSTGSRPVFVYATDPEVAGTAWYLHLRTAEFLTHDEARIRAGRLGRIDESSALFQSAVKLLAGKP